MPDQVLTRDGPVAVPMDYKVPQAGELMPLMVRALVDGGSATTSFYAVVQILAPDGRVMGTARTDAIAAGGSADCTWFPGAELDDAADAAAGTEVLLLDTRSVAGVTANTVLVSGQTYIITVEGTFSYVNKDLDVGSPNANAIFPTSGGVARLSTEVGLDPDTIFAYWSGSVPGGGIGHSTLFQMNLGSGFAHVEPTDGPHTTPRSDYTYTYQVTGQGSAPSFIFTDSVYTDNYGYLRITIAGQGQSTQPGAGPSNALLRSNGSVAVWEAQPAITESDLALANNTTADVTTATHGFAPKAPNDATKFLDGTGAYSTPSGGPPSGAAGGVLAGTYPNPSLAATGVAAGTYGDSGDVPQITVGSDGRVSAVSNVSIGGGTVVAADGWVDDTSETWTYASGSGGGTATFTVPGDLTAKYSAGTRIKLTQTTVKYFVVASSAVASGTTTVTITAGTDYTLANAAISANFHSYVLTPQGYPGWFNYSGPHIGWSSFTLNVCRFTVVGRTCIVHYIVQGTSNNTGTDINLPIPCSSSAGSNTDTVHRNQNAGTFAATPGLAEIVPSGTVATFFRDMSGTAWTASGSKEVSGVLTYEI